ncbi:hypothetical protein [Myxacorys almedinensis]|uniref:Uncharacterized protein n=1 Tax=Myxacorys almedinensis A TaxID=2690445 RepID=A0A8J8CHY6_9CYAN|nr:hypothetical protein [Myxacorys almedinensis]NDJ17193.1 hypothetical protein [Myxacorys almedinensis A]
MGSTFQFGLVCFIVLFGLSQFFQWAQQMTLPLPIFVLGGAFLAIASNFNKRAGLPFSLLDERSHQLPETPVSKQSPELVESEAMPIQPAAQLSKPISFTIPKPEK